MRTATWAKAAMGTRANRNAHTPTPRRLPTSGRTTASTLNPLRRPQMGGARARVGEPLGLVGLHDVLGEQAKARRPSVAPLPSRHGPQPAFDDPILQRMEGDHTQPPARPKAIG